MRVHKPLLPAKGPELGARLLFNLWVSPPAYCQAPFTPPPLDLSLDWTKSHLVDQAEELLHWVT